MRTVTQKVAALFLAVFLMLGAFGAFSLHRRQAEDLRQQTAFFTAFGACDKRKPLDKNYEPYRDLSNIPCFQSALKVGPDKSLEYMLAILLVKQGRYDEARPLFVEIAHPDAFGLLFRRERTAGARRMLLPGVMMKERAAMARSEQAQRDLVALSVKNNAEEQAFLRLHADVSNGMITRMSVSDKAQWLQMRSQHAKEADALYKIRDGF